MGVHAHMQAHNSYVKRILLKLPSQALKTLGNAKIKGIFTILILSPCFYILW